MPRDSSGTYTATAGQPVVAGTTIDATVFNNLVNDLIAEMTDSLSRSGKGGLTAVLKLVDGLVAGPAFSFTSETGSGLYRAGAGDVRLAILGVARLTVTATGLTVTGSLNNTTTASLANGNLLVAATGEPSGPYVWRRVVATAQTSCSSDVTAVDIAGLTFACATATKYLVRASLFVTSAAGTTGNGVSAKSTGAPTVSSGMFTHCHWLAAGSFGTWGVLRYNGASIFLDTPTAFAETTTLTHDRFEGYFVTTSTGTFQLRLVSEVNTSAVTVEPGSYLEWMAFT